MLQHSITAVSPQPWAADHWHAFTCICAVLCCVTLRVLAQWIQVSRSIGQHHSHSLACWAVLGCGAGVQVLRETLGCSLPVEVAWQGPKEMDNVTLAALQHRFGPLRGFDVQAMPYPPEMRR